MVQSEKKYGAKNKGEEGKKKKIIPIQNTKVKLLQNS